MKTRLLCACLLAGPVLAWGPHPDITRAALETFGSDAVIVRQLGPETNSLCSSSLMPDWRRTLRRDKAAWFNTDDFLLFPGMAQHLNHMCPEVKATYAPFFRRALQALRTESAFNACRWVGSVVHFVEDSGAPPHAAMVSGDLHGKTENWANPERLHIFGYQPQMLGQTDEEAVAGLLKRMDSLIEFSKPRFARAKPFALSGDRTHADPILVESAEECARVVADLLRTFGELAEKTPAENTTTLRGIIASQPSPDLERMPAKVVLLGTTYSTLADSQGCYIFRHIPPGQYSLAVLRAGSAIATETMNLAAGQEVTRDISVVCDQPAGNLVRNPAMALRWLASDHPDGWYHAKNAWEGDLLPLQAGAHYRLQIAWQADATGQVAVKLFGSAGPAKPAVATHLLAVGTATLDFNGTPETAYAQVVFTTDKTLDKICRHVALWKLAGN